MVDNPAPWNILMAYLGIPQLAAPPGPMAQTGAAQSTRGGGGVPGGNPYQPYGAPSPTATMRLPRPSAGAMPTNQELAFDP